MTTLLLLTILAADPAASPEIFKRGSTVEREWNIDATSFEERIIADIMMRSDGPYRLSMNYVSVFGVRATVCYEAYYLRPFTGRMLIGAPTLADAPRFRDYSVVVTITEYEYPGGPTAGIAAQSFLVPPPIGTVPESD